VRSTLDNTTQLKLSWKYTYGAKDRLEKVKAVSGSDFLLGYEYDYNALNNRLHI